MIKLFIVGFPRDMSEIELEEIFSVYGLVDAVKIITDKETGKSKGYGFLTMTDQSGADRAIIAIDGAAIDGRLISVRVATGRQVVPKNAHSMTDKSLNAASDYQNGNKQMETEKKKRRRIQH